MLQFLLIAHPYMSPYLSTITTTLSVLFFLTVSYATTGIWASSAARPSINITHSGIIHGLQCSSRVSEGMEIFQTSTSTNTSLHTSRPYDHWHTSHTTHTSRRISLEGLSCSTLPLLWLCHSHHYVVLQHVPSMLPMLLGRLGPSHQQVSDSPIEICPICFELHVMAPPHQPHQALCSQ